MRQIVSAPFFIAGGALAGVASAYVAAQMLGTTAAAVDSNWKSRDISAASAVHPYTIAHFLLAGRLPPSVGQFVELSADRDAEGQPVTAACIYTLSLKAGKAPHWWSLSAYAGGQTSSNSAIMSQTSVFESDGSVRVTVAREPQPGNWLKAPASGYYSLLYTASENKAGTSGRPSMPEMFSMARSGC